MGLALEGVQERVRAGRRELRAVALYVDSLAA
jgi:hypothetical protein